MSRHHPEIRGAGQLRLSGSACGAWSAVVFVMVIMGGAVPAGAQSSSPSGAAPPPTTNANAPLDIYNPVSILQHASEVMPFGPAGAAAPVQSATGERNGAATPAAPTDGPRKGLSTSLSILLLLTVLTIAPSILIMTTSFTRIVIVLSLLRQAIGTQSLPPSQVIVGLSLFMTLIVMQPTFERVNREAIIPLQNNEIDETQAWERAKQPLRDFMFAQIEYGGNSDDIYMILEYRGILDQVPRDQIERGHVDMLSLIPAFILSELKIAFLMGFRLYLPFLIIDMVVSSVLISMGMLMLPPVLISLPFKLLLFVLVDGWHLVVGNLLHSFVQGGPAG
ncbi:MAG: flagellar type III secretion system pore protein FliP [Phycisphaeraceae bacterium]